MATGLTITRNGFKFICEWKLAEGGRVKEFYWTDKYQGTGTTWSKVSISQTATSYTKNGTASSFYPLGSRKMQYFGAACKVDGQAMNFPIYTPKTPSLSITKQSSTTHKFQWSVPVDDEDNYPCYRVQYDSVLLRDSKENDGSKVDWTTTSYGTRYSSTGQPSDSITITENGSTLADGHSYTRWIRVRGQGMGGDGYWVYGRHVYAMPNKPSITKNVITPTTSGYTAQVWATASMSVDRPIDKLEYQYAIATPANGGGCPNNANWETGLETTTNINTTGAIFTIPSTVEANQCMWIRVNSVYDDRTTYGDAVLAQTGKLSTPTGLSVSVDQSTFRATVTATNAAASVPDSFLVVRYYNDSNPEGIDVGIINHGSTSTICQLPVDTAPTIGVYAATGSSTYYTDSDNVKIYTVIPRMTSEVTRTGGTVPVPPTNVTAYKVDETTARVSWDWTWQAAESAEISWSTNPFAWESTEAPSVFNITNQKASTWLIAGLASDKTWYIRVRLFYGVDKEATYGGYSEIVKVNTAKAPRVENLKVTPKVGLDGIVEVNWDYISEDGTAQQYATIGQWIAASHAYETIGTVDSANSFSFTPSSLGWTAPSSHMISVKVASESGMESSWPTYQETVVQEAPYSTITAASLVTKTVTEEEETYTYSALETLPLTVTVISSDTISNIECRIERAAPYTIARPDEEDSYSYEGEVIASQIRQGAGSFSFSFPDLKGTLDDGAEYFLVSSITDQVGQTTEDRKRFKVEWNAQPVKPGATARIDDGVAIITPIAGTGAANETYDIYRLSADKPQLIYKGAAAGDEIVDPFPTIGDLGGHRVVAVSVYGDYITAEKSFAWIDIGKEDGDYIKTPYNILDSEKGRAKLIYNADLSSAWKKDFKETAYLGGSIQGDWNKAVNRTGTLSVTAVAEKDQETVKTMRALAAFPGLCHIRTKDGSNYYGDVEVSEKYNYMEGVKTYEYSLSITRVDYEELDGLPLSDWEE